MNNLAMVGKSVAVVIPTYNESENVQKIIEAVLHIVPRAHVVIVDDDSPDKTAQKAQKLQKKYKNLNVLERKKKSGRGTAVIAGFHYALQNTSAQIFIEMDADFSHNPAELTKLIDKVKTNVFIIGSRYVTNAKIIGWPVSRRLLSHAANALIRLLFQYPLKDYTNGYRAYSRKAAQNLVKHTYTTNGFILLSESILVLYKNGFRSTEIPTVFTNRTEGNSKASVGEFCISLLSIFSIFVNMKKTAK